MKWLEPRPGLPGDAGDSLVEVLVALAVLSIGVAAIMFGLGTNITTSVTNRTQSEGVVALNAAAEYVKSLPQAILCAATSAVSISPTEVSAPSGFTITYGPVATVGTDPCTAIARIPIQLSGNGFQTLTVDVVRRG